MAMYSYVFCKEVVCNLGEIEMFTEESMLMLAIGVVDVSMVLNLIIVCRLEIVEKDKDNSQFNYLGMINPNTLKHKLMISLISISAVHLLESFVSPNIDAHRIAIQIAIHLVFVVSALAITFMDKIGHSHH